ncbi:MAG: hypothetical protein VZR27_02470 [Acutalibacteraceae bacterium]|nr:hypothetical protein [Clostridia bacterium]MEE3449557.1 hypothetical protein [Acutalibacteraceae bacterium]
MNKRKKEAANMFFSAFLVLAYAVCSHFIMQLASKSASAEVFSGISILLVVVFGALLFYATRVGNGKQVVRFSPSVLILMVLPSIYAISAYYAVGLPLHEQMLRNDIMIDMAAVTLGYGIPYTFLSGFETVAAEDVYFPEHFEDDKKDENDEDE